MDQCSKKILSMTITDKRETQLKSTNMEKLGLQKCLREVRDLHVTELTTDAHPQITKFMSE